MMLELLRAEHPLLEAIGLTCELPRPLGEMHSPDWLLGLLALDPHTDPRPPFSPDETVKTAIRKLLRHGGFKPSGRSKPASEYLAGAAAEHRLGSINPLVDACNAVSLHSGLPISCIDLDRVQLPLHISLAAPGQSYEFNQSGQVIDLTGLLCLHDARGPCANAIKDAQRSKTQAGTRRSLSVMWSSRELPGRVSAAHGWYCELLHRLGARVDAVAIEPNP